MFRDFSFNPTSRPSSAHPGGLVDTAVCPKSMSLEPQNLPRRPPTPPPCLVGDLAQKFTQQNLRLEAPNHIRHNAYPSAPLTPPSDEGMFPTEPWAQTDRPAYCRVSASVLRMQRQANARMQCCSSHIKDVSRLVRMVEREEQCTVSSESTSPSTVDESDEGVDMDFDSSVARTNLLAGTPLRRSGERRENVYARVTKSVRMRRRMRDDDGSGGGGASTARRIA